MLFNPLYSRQRTSKAKRFPWTFQFDVLACDAYANLSARYRTHYRLEWATVVQVILHVPRNSARTQVAYLTEQPGAEAYLRRFGDRWHELWLRRRGSEELPDKYPQLNAVELDLKLHVEYL